MLEKNTDEKSTKSPEITMLWAKDVAKILGINQNQATELFKRSDFPSLNDAGHNKVEKTALFTWLQSRHARDDDEDEIEM